MHTALLDRSHRAEWDGFVAACRYGHTLQSWTWGELKGVTGQEPLRLGWYDGPTLKAVAQVLLRPLPLGLGKLAYVPKGPVLDWEDPALVREVVAGLRRLAADHHATSLKLEPEVREPSGVSGWLSELGLAAAEPVQMRSTIWVDLTGDEDTILARMKQKTRYNIRLAEKKGVTIRSGQVADLDGWYAMYEATARRDGFTIHDLSYYRQVLGILGEAGEAELLLAEHDGDLLAGIIVFRFGRAAQYMYGASSNEKRNLMAPYLAQWAGMRWARTGGAAIYDLWGIPDQLTEDQDLWGVYRHKRGYGGEIVRYVGAFDLVRSPLQYLALERVARPLFKRVTRLGV